MWNYCKQQWEMMRARRAEAVEAQTRSKIVVSGQKWLGPGETLRIIEVESGERNYTLAVLQTKTASQLVELSCSDSQPRGRSASCA